MSYGFGASTFLKGDHPACPLFSVTGDFLDPFVENNTELNRCYFSTLKAVKLGLPVLFQEILKLVCDLAQAEMNQANKVDNDSDESEEIEDEEEKENEEEEDGRPAKKKEKKASENKVGRVKNYFVFVLMMVGVIDDFKDALNELLRAANLPLSVIVVKMGKNEEDNDSQKFI